MRLLIVLLFLPAIANCQNKYLALKSYPDHSKIQELKKRHATASYKLLVYQPSSSVDNISSILVIENRNGTHYWVINKDTVLRSGLINGGNLFSYKNYLQTGATEKEDNLKFVPPLMNGVETENLIYEDPTVDFYFQYGKNVTEYSPDQHLESYRKEWISIISKELLKRQILPGDTK